jgi:hypothetical protein
MGEKKREEKRREALRDLSLRMPTLSQERKGKRKPRLLRRNDGWGQFA